MAKQNAIVVEERKQRHEERTKQIQEEMDDRNMEMKHHDYDSNE